MPVETLLRSNKTRARLAVAVFWLLLCANCLLFLSSYHLYKVYTNTNASLDDSFEAGIIWGYAYQFQQLITLLSIFFFIRWFRRAYFNLHQLNEPSLGRSEGWAAGAWFVPVLNFFLPYRIGREIWDYTQRSIPGKTDYRSSSLVGWWWFGFLLSYYGVNAVFLIQFLSNASNDLTLAAITLMYAEPIVILAVLATIVFISQTAVFERELLESRNSMDILEHLV